MIITFQEYEEGDICPRCGNGWFYFPSPKNCSCHISAPCSECESLVLKCDNCGYELDKEDSEDANE